MPKTYNYVVPYKRKPPKTRFFAPTHAQRGKQVSKRKLPAWMLEHSGIHENDVSLSRYGIHHRPYPGMFARGSLFRDLRDNYWRTPKKKLRLKKMLTPAEYAEYRSRVGKRNAELRWKDYRKQPRPTPIHKKHKKETHLTTVADRDKMNQEIVQQQQEKEKKRRLYKLLMYNINNDSEIKEDAESILRGEADLDQLHSFYKTHHGQHVMRELFANQQRKRIPLSSEYDYQWNPELGKTEIVPKQDSYDERLPREQQIFDPEWTQFDDYPESDLV